MPRLRFLPGVDQERPVVESCKARPGQRLVTAGRQPHDARLVMVFGAAHLDKVRRVDAVLVTQHLQIAAHRHLALHR